jgi:hypothetical protein
MTYSTPIAGQFYPFASSMAKKLREAHLSAAEWRFWAYLIEHDPWGDRYKELDSFDILRECGISKATYYRAKAKLQKLGLFDFQESKISFRNLTGISQIRQESQKSDSSLKNEIANSEMRQEPQKRENSPLESALSKASKTLQTFSDLLKTLSEGMRESFEKFCLKKIQECSFKIGSRKAWLNKHGAEYLQEFKETYSYVLANPEVVPPKAAPAPFDIPDIPYLKRIYKDGWKDAAIHFGLIDPNSPEEEIQNESEPVRSLEVMPKPIADSDNPQEPTPKPIADSDNPQEPTPKPIADSDNPQKPTPPTSAIGAKHKQFAEGDRVVIAEVGNTHHGQTGKIIAASSSSKEDKYRIALDKESHFVRELTIKIPKGCKFTYLMKL